MDQLKDLENQLKELEEMIANHPDRKMLEEVHRFEIEALRDQIFTLENGNS